MMLRVTALIQPIVFHPGVLARLVERHRSGAAAYRATEGLRPVVYVPELAKR
jgi:hypothetical protein